MHTRELGNDSTRVSEIGLGTWQIGSDWAPLTEKTALEILSAAVDAGVSFFDTADIYGEGRSESIIGKFLSETKADAFVATKLGRFPRPGFPENFSLATMREHTQASLERLGVEALDLTQLHCVPTEELRRGEVFDHLRTLKREGLIRRFGASVETVEEALLCLEHDDLASLQIIFNVYRQRPSEQLFERARKQGVALIIRLPLASGLLSGKFSKDTTFGRQDHRNYNADGSAFHVGETFSGLTFGNGLRLTDTLLELVPRGMNLAQMSLRWILDHEAVTTVIPGASTPRQVQSNAAASDLDPLEAALHEKLREYFEEEVEALVRGAV